jgi:hypothetical protein
MTEEDLKDQQPWQLDDLANVARVLGRKLSPDDLSKIEWMPSMFADRIGIPLRPMLWLKDDLGDEYDRKAEAIRAAKRGA